MNVLFELFNTGSIPLVFVYSLGFRFIINKSGQIETLEKSKEIFGVFQYLPIFVYGFVRLFLVPCYFVYTPETFQPFDVLAFFVICDSSSIFQYLIPLTFLFTNTKLAAKLWNKPFLNSTLNQVYIQHQNSATEKDRENGENIGNQNDQDNDQVPPVSIVSIHNENDNQNNP